MKRRISIVVILLAGLIALASQSCSCSSETSRDHVQAPDPERPRSRIAPLPHKNVPRPALRGTGPVLQANIDERFRGAVPAAAIEQLDAPHATGPASHGKPAGTRRAQRLAQLLAAAEQELGLDRETRDAVSLILSRFDVHRHALRQSERRGAIARDDAQASLGVLLRERNFMLRDYLGRERARRIFQLERAQRANAM